MSLKKINYLLPLLLLLLYFASCSKKEDESNSLPTKEEYESEVVNPDYVPIDWEITRLLECKPDEGVYSFRSSASTASLRAGSVLTIDADTTGYIVIVKQITRDGDVVRIKTKPGTLCDIFANTEFTLASSEQVVTRVNDKVYYPESIVYRDSDGELKSMDIATTRSGVSLTENLWSWGKDFSGGELFSGDNYKLYLKKASFKVGVDLNLTLSFGQRTLSTSTAEAFVQYQSKALKVSASIIGTASTEQTLQFDVWGEYHNLNQQDELWKCNMFKPIDIKFRIGYVPVYIRLNADLYRGASFDVEGKMSAYMGYTDTATGRLGISWQQETGYKSVSEFKNDFNLIYPTIEGQGEINAKAWFYPRIQLWLYGIIGPSFDIKPYLGTHVDGGFKEELLNSSNDFCAWSLRNFTGLDVAAGLSFAFLGHEINNYTTPNINVIDKTLYRSPYDINIVSSSSEKVEAGINNSVYFEVYDVDSLFYRKLLTPLPQIVKFEGNGNLSSKYGITSKGKVSVDWIPDSAADTLYAILYNSDGSKLKQTKFFGKEPMAITGSSSDITSNSAKIVCSYANVPTTAEYGVTIVSNTNSYSLPASIDGSSGDYTFELKELASETAYSYKAYILYKGKYYEGETKNFTTESKKNDEITEGRVVDLGLSVKWASYNLGASAPEEPGGLYGWGDPTGTHTEQAQDEKYGNYYGGRKEDKEACLLLYNSLVYNDSENQITPNDISGTEFDVVRAKWGGNWRMPRRREFLELCSNKCIWERLFIKGTLGYKVTGPNGNSIFLPITFYRIGETIIKDAKDNYGHNIECQYWTSQRVVGEGAQACPFIIFICDVGDIYRGYIELPWTGCAIRPVTDY